MYDAPREMTEARDRILSVIPEDSASDRPKPGGATEYERVHRALEMSAKELVEALNRGDTDAARRLGLSLRKVLDLLEELLRGRNA
jgi:hypothetical protein